MNDRAWAGSISVPRNKWTVRRKMVVSIGALIALVVVRHFACHFVAFFIGFSQTDFDSSGWKSNWTCRCTPLRMQMADDLIATQHLLGQTKEQVTALLGAPDRNAYIQQYEPPGAFVYQLAPHPLADDYWLVIHFDETAHVSKAGIKMD